MSTWQGVRREVAGAWRSLRYDLARRSSAKRRGQRNATGVRSRPRRLLAAALFGALAIVGAAGTYVGVVIGLNALLAGGAPPPEQGPAAVRPARPVTQDVALTPDPARHPAAGDASSPSPSHRVAPSRTPSRRGVDTAPGSAVPTPVRTSPSPSPSPTPSSPSPSPVVTASPSATSPPTADPSPPPTNG